jgi:hypothetical protein
MITTGRAAITARLTGIAPQFLVDDLETAIGCAPKTLDDNGLRSRGARITKPLGARPWSCIDFYVEDLDGYILCFSEPTAQAP